MNIVDASGWLEYFAECSNADFLPPPSKTPQIYLCLSSVTHTSYRSPFQATVFLLEVVWRLL